MKFISAILLTFVSLLVNAQQFTISGTVKFNATPAVGATVALQPLNLLTQSQANGFFQFGFLEPGSYDLVVNYAGAKEYRQLITLENENWNQEITLTFSDATLKEVTVTENNEQASGNLR